MIPPSYSCQDFSLLVKAFSTTLSLFPLDTLILVRKSSSKDSRVKDCCRKCSSLSKTMSLLSSSPFLRSGRLDRISGFLFAFPALWCSSVFYSPPRVSMESSWSPCRVLIESMESLWSLCGLHVDSMRTPLKIHRFYGESMDFGWTMISFGKIYLVGV